MKVYDCFTFYNEFELLELRLKSLWDIVDYFVLVEASKTQANEPKPFYFEERKKDFEEFLPKIKHIKINMEIPYSGVGDWSIENSQRNCIEKGLEDAEPDDLVFISDLDEIPSIDILQRIKNRRESMTYMCLLPIPNPPPSHIQSPRIQVPCRLTVNALDLLEVCPIVMDQEMHNYYLDWIAIMTWQGTILTKKKNITTPQELRNLRTVYPRVQNGGYHFSWMGNIDRVIKKMTSIVEGKEMVVNSNGRLTDRDLVKSFLKNGKLFWFADDDERSQMVPYNIKKINLPYIKKFVKKYPQFLKATDPSLK